MKKFLLSASVAVSLFFDVAVYGMQPPSAESLIKADNPLQEQMEELYKTHTVKDMYEEITAASREPNEREIPFIPNLLGVLGLGGETEVRVVDAESRIKGLYLSRQDKTESLNMLKPGVKIDTYIKEWIQENRSLFHCSDELKSLIEEILIEESNKSEIYRQMVIAYIAPTKSFQSLASRNTHIFNEPQFYVFYVTNKYEFSYKGIGIPHDMREFRTYSYFPQEQTERAGDGLFVVSLSRGKCLFHEFGHALDPIPIFLCNDMTEDIVSNLLGAELTEEGLKELVFQRQKKDWEELLRIFPEAPIEGFGIEFRCIGDLLAYIQENFSSIRENFPYYIEKVKKEASQYLMTDNGESWQILGVRFIKKRDNAGGILYVNLLSDFNLCSKIGMPMQICHIGVGGFSEKEMHFLKFTLPESAYDAMLHFCGSSLAEYRQKLRVSQK